MITNLLLDVLHYLLQGLIAVLPAWAVNIPDTVSTLINTFLAYNALLPAVECMTVMTLFLTLGGAVSGLKWAVKVIDYIADIIP